MSIIGAILLCVLCMLVGLLITYVQAISTSFLTENYK
ncbi:hypothetical protein OCA8868_03080 [Octadecabacter ascidiaceicola]|uniref:Uncharacterized protein n=1 Tax=Octadecabacter ascidiaceicola TaxID=1655543 RepID=A0A238KMQ5_9RHOB|nr:hypothetical protein OCA8868_03080 [Octadecabacter ascidiaceicola]